MKYFIIILLLLSVKINAGEIIWEKEIELPYGPLENTLYCSLQDSNNDLIFVFTVTSYANSLHKAFFVKFDLNGNMKSFKEYSFNDLPILPLSIYEIDNGYRIFCATRQTKEIKISRLSTLTCLPMVIDVDKFGDTVQVTIPYDLNNSENLNQYGIIYKDYLRKYTNNFNSYFYSVKIEDKYIPTKRKVPTIMCFDSLGFLLWKKDLDTLNVPSISIYDFHINQYGIFSIIYDLQEYADTNINYLDYAIISDTTGIVFNKFKRKRIGSLSNPKSILSLKDYSMIILSSERADKDSNNKYKLYKVDSNKVISNEYIVPDIHTSTILYNIYNSYDKGIFLTGVTRINIDKNNTENERYSEFIIKLNENFEEVFYFEGTPYPFNNRKRIYTLLELNENTFVVAGVKNESKFWIAKILMKPVSISMKNNDELNILNYPNPASDYIEVAVPREQMPGDAQQVRIYNMLGQSVINYELQSTNNEARAKIDIRHLPAGLYYIRIGSHGLPFIKN